MSGSRLLSGSRFFSVFNVIVSLQTLCLSPGFEGSLPGSTGRGAPEILQAPQKLLQAPLEPLQNLDSYGASPGSRLHWSPFRCWHKVQHFPCILSQKCKNVIPAVNHWTTAFLFQKYWNLWPKLNILVLNMFHSSIEKIPMFNRKSVHFQAIFRNKIIGV